MHTIAVLGDRCFDRRSVQLHASVCILKPSRSDFKACARDGRLNAYTGFLISCDFVALPQIIFRWGTTLAAVLLTIWYRNVRNRSMMTSMEMRELNSDAELAQPLIRNSRSRYFRVAVSA